ncbi:hypothetical protein, partial [Bacillus cereus]|uniref:hypothetical protein n=1 Tax=Bacillus cereus TaxID=1396 RepID=UPI0034D4E4D0
DWVIDFRVWYLVASGLARINNRWFESIFSREWVIDYVLVMLMSWIDESKLYSHEEFSGAPIRFLRNHIWVPTSGFRENELSM